MEIARYIGLDKKKIFQHKIANIFLPISFHMLWLLRRTVSLRWFLSTHNICFG